MSNPDRKKRLAEMPDFLKSEAGRRAFNSYPSPDPFDARAFIAAEKARRAAVPRPAAMDATDGPVCGCGRPSTHDSGWCGTHCRDGRL